MIIQSKFFDSIEINEQDILFFEHGLLGFEDIKKYALIDIDDGGIFKCLQSVEDKATAFIVINPWDVIKDYEIDIDDSELIYFNDKDLNNYLIYTIVTVSKDRMTTNLIGPVIINTNTRRGKQIVMHKSNYTTKHIVKLFEEKEKICL